jgi:hypothetical protein
MRKRIMVLPHENYELAQDVLKPLFIMEKRGGFTLAFSFIALKSNRAFHNLSNKKFSNLKLIIFF